MLHNHWKRTSLALESLSSASAMSSLQSWSYHLKLFSGWGGLKYVTQRYCIPANCFLGGGGSNSYFLPFHSCKPCNTLLTSDSLSQQGMLIAVSLWKRGFSSI